MSGALAKPALSTATGGPRTRPVPGSRPRPQARPVRLHKATPGLCPKDAVGDASQGQTLGAGPVAGSLPLRRGGEGARGEPWISLTGGCAEEALGDLLPQSRHEAEGRLAIQEGHVVKPQFVLALHKALEVCRLDLVLGQQQVATLSVLELGVQFLGQALLLVTSVHFRQAAMVRTGHLPMMMHCSAE